MHSVTHDDEYRRTDFFGQKKEKLNYQMLQKTRNIQWDSDMSFIIYANFKLFVWMFI